MHHRSHRHSECCESRCQPPISWPQRPSLPSFPGIGIYWPMPSLIPMWPSVGSWGGMRSGYEPREYSNRRFDMDRYRCCEPRCCERCGEYDCRCERRCERCGEYSCRCERRCERCGKYDCRCRGYSYARLIELIVLPTDLMRNYTISIDRDYFGSDAQPIVKVLAQDPPSTAKISAVAVHIRQCAVEILVKLDEKTPSGLYRGLVLDQLKPHGDPVANLKLMIYP